MIKKYMTAYEENRNEIWLKFSHRFYYNSFLKTLVGKRKCLIWGASCKSNWFLELCKQSGIKITGYIDKNIKISFYKDFPVYQPDILNPQKYFVFVSLENKYPEVLQQLDEYKMKVFQDYLYPSGNQVVLMGNRREYFDLNGNEVRGIIDGYRVELSKGSKVIVGKNCKIDKSVLIRLGQNAVLVIEDDCIIGPGCIIDVSNSICRIGASSYVGRHSIIHLDNAVVNIEEKFSCGSSFQLGAGQFAVCKIAQDCMFSTDIRIQCSDSHNYFDYAKKQNIGMTKQYCVNVGEHVWVGAKSNLLYGTDIGAGSIVGMGSLVNGKFPPNTVLAGNPARVVRKHVAWTRETETFIEDDILFEPYFF